VRAAAGSLRVLRAAQRTAVPWKNGGGLTREVAAFPPGSDLEGFEWRVSIAEVRAPGPFSLFPGVDRCLTVLSGRLSLAIDGQAALSLSPESSAVAFPGDVPAFAEPRGGPVTDLNVMTRRGRRSARLTRGGAAGPARLEPRAMTTLLVALSDLMVRRGQAEVTLSTLDAVEIGRGAECTIAARSGSDSFHLIEIF
jgi:uncharacterized protein